jgi:hypothetical protein
MTERSQAGVIFYNEIYRLLMVRKHESGTLGSPQLPLRYSIFFTLRYHPDEGLTAAYDL